MAFVVPVFEIPLSGSPQRFSIVLNGTQLHLTFLYRDAPPSCAGGGGWIMDIADAADTPLVCGIPLITGADLLAQYEYLALNGFFWVYSDGEFFATPTFDNLGVGSHLMWGSTPA